MSSIMRCRSGLMALSVIGDAPVLMKVANPSSQDRTPCRAILLAVSPAAGHYRASGLVHWHRTDMPTLLSDVRCWDQSRKHLLAASISPFDPTETSNLIASGDDQVQVAIRWPLAKG